jgi:heme-degrading monooxygenase HmoA
MNIIIKRKLKDYDAWKKVVSDLDGLRKQHGSQGMTVYRSAKDPNEVYLVVDWEDGRPYSSYFNLPEVQKALADTGTTEVIEVSESFHLVE